MAGVTVAALGLLLAVAVLPFALGLLGAPILAVMFAPLYARLRRRATPRGSAAIVIVVALLAILIPVVGLTALIVSELPSVLSGPGVERILTALTEVRLGRFSVGTELSAMGGELVAWVSRQAIAMFGSATFVAVNLLIAFFGLYFLLLAGSAPWEFVVRYLPFSPTTAERLRTRFHDVTHATVLGIGATALLQGAIVGLSFWLLDLSHPLLWGAVTGVASILPVLGSSLVWLPGVAVLALDHRYSAAVALCATGFVVASNVDNVVRPLIFKRVSHIHPLVSIVGAFAGMRYFGLLGVLLGPLALVYFIELVRAFEQEYGEVAPRSISLVGR